MLNTEFPAICKIEPIEELQFFELLIEYTTVQGRGSSSGLHAAWPVFWLSLLPTYASCEYLQRKTVVREGWHLVKPAR